MQTIITKKKNRHCFIITITKLFTVIDGKYKKQDHFNHTVYNNHTFTFVYTIDIKSIL